jgi:hypothetical protein
VKLEKQGRATRNGFKAKAMTHSTYGLSLMCGEVQIPKPNRPWIQITPSFLTIIRPRSLESGIVKGGEDKKEKDHTVMEECLVHQAMPCEPNLVSPESHGRVLWMQITPQCPVYASKYPQSLVQWPESLS